VLEVRGPVDVAIARQTTLRTAWWPENVGEHGCGNRGRMRRRRTLIALAVALVLVALLSGEAIRQRDQGPRTVHAVAVGDIACDPGDTKFNGGQGAANRCAERTTSQLVGSRPDAVFLLGDQQYENATLAKFRASFAPTWGRFNDVNHPAAGNHEYVTKGAAGYFDYFGKAAGNRKTGWYSYDVGDWHVIVLNSNCRYVGGCDLGSPQERWLRADLNTHAKQRCTLAYWHHPRYSSGVHGSSTSYRRWWKDLFDANADLVLVGHDHDYERFAPQDPYGARNLPRGIREFVVGTGGKHHGPLQARASNSEAFNNDAYGILDLTLRPGGYDWRFLPEPGKSFTDAGSGPCH
jgi:hypothetical protein